jgi:3,4-dihydroxyphenylacetate 2,3-dioxygenase
LNGRLEEARHTLPSFARLAGVESGGRHLAALLGALDASGKTFRGQRLGWGQSSGSGNPVLVLEAESATTVHASF